MRTDAEREALREALQHIRDVLATDTIIDTADLIERADKALCASTALSLDLVEKSTVESDETLVLKMPDGRRLLFVDDDDVRVMSLVRDAGECHE